LYGDWLGTQMERATLANLIVERPLVSDYFLGSFWVEALARLQARPRLWWVVLPALASLFAIAITAYRGRRRLHFFRLPSLLILVLACILLVFQFRTHVSGRYVGSFVSDVFRSFIGNFGQLSVRLPETLYELYAVAFGVAAIGILAHLWQVGFEDRQIGVATLFVTLAVAGMVYYNLTFSQLQGRYLFLVISLVGLMSARGLRSISGEAKPGAMSHLATIAVLWLFVIADIVGLHTMYSFWYKG
jgi:hypothetical protein